MKAAAGGERCFVAIAVDGVEGAGEGGREPAPKR